MASANRPIRLEAAGRGPGGAAPRPLVRPSGPQPSPAASSRRRLLSEKRAGDGEDLGLHGVGGGEGRAPGHSLPGAAWAAGRSAGRLGPSAGEKGLSRTLSRAVPGPRPYRLLLSSRATGQPSASGPGASSRAPPRPIPAATPALERPPRRSRGLTRQGEHRVVHFAAHHAGALRDAVHPQPLVHGLGGDDIVASVRAHLPLRDGGACHQAHPAQQSHGKAQQLQARIGHFRPQNRRGAPGGRVFKLPKEAKKKLLVDCLQIWSPE